MIRSRHCKNIVVLMVCRLRARTKRYEIIINNETKTIGMFVGQQIKQNRPIERPTVEKVFQILEIGVRFAAEGCLQINRKLV